VAPGLPSRHGALLQGPQNRSLTQLISRAPTNSRLLYVLPPFFVFHPQDDRRKYIQVETLLEQLDTKFDDMSSQIIDRSALPRFPLSCGVSSCMVYGSHYMHAVMQMSQRVDALEASIQDIINGDAPSSSSSSIPSSPSATPTTLQSRRTRSGLQ
jgi:hypothetical protein